MTSVTDRAWSEVSVLSSFFDRLDDAGAISVRELLARLEADGALDVDDSTEGIIYHDRGIRVPGYDATFVADGNADGSRRTWSVEVDAVGPRQTWAVFDAALAWDCYVLQTDDLTALAWITDQEFASEEAEHFPSKHDAVAAGRFSFGIFIPPATEWRARVADLGETEAPAYLLRDDGKTFYPPTQDDFYAWVDSTPEEFRRTGGDAPRHLGIDELEVSIAQDKVDDDSGALRY